MPRAHSSTGPSTPCERAPGPWSSARAVAVRAAGGALVLGVAFAVGLGSPGCKADAPAVGVAGALAAAAPAQAADERVAELYVSTGVVGYAEPCGCTTTPLGGIQRLATVLARGAPARALLDAGSLLFPTEPLTDTTREQHVLKARMLARVYRQLGAVALNVGPTDVKLGVGFLEELQREGAVPLVSTNLRPVGEGGPAIAQSLLREVGGIRVGVLGVARPEDFTGGALAAIEYAPAVRAEQALLRKRGAEVVVVLAHVGDRGADELAREVPELDVIVRAPGTPIGQRPAPPRRVGSVIVLEAGSQGQHIGRLTLRFGRQTPPRPLVLDDAGAEAEARSALLAKKIRAYKTELAAWQADPTKAEAVASKQKQLTELERQLSAPPPATGAQPTPSVRFELVPLGVDVPSDPVATEILGAYYAALRALNLSKGDTSLCTPRPGEPTYVGTEACKACHLPAYEQWRTTKHGKAWATLESQDKHFDLTCIGCHTVGYQKPGGFCRLVDVGPLKDVGCENCHGAGSVHATTGDKAKIARGVTEATCTSGCHVPEHSDGFVYGAYLPRVLGPGHGAPQGTP